MDALSAVRSTIEIRHLRCFIAVADALSFTRAAERLGVSQPAVSEQIKELERVLGTSLFDRLGRVVRLTQAGMAFRKGAELVLRELDDACAAVDNVEGIVAGHLEIGVVPAVCVPWVPEVLAEFSVHYPGVRITIHERSSNEIETEVEGGRLHLGIGLLSHSSPAITYEPITSSDLALIVPESHALAGRKSVGIQELNGARMVLLSEAFQIRSMVDSAFLHCRCRPRVVFEVCNVAAVLAVVAKAGVPTILPSMVVYGHAASGLSVVKLVGPNLAVNLGLMWPAGAVASPAARLYADLTIQVAKRWSRPSAAAPERAPKGKRASDA